MSTLSHRFPKLLFLTTVLACGLSFVLYFNSINSSTAIEPGFRFGDAIVAVVFTAVGAAICSRNPRNRVGWLFCVPSLLAISLLFEQVATYGLGPANGAAPGQRWAAWIAGWIWTPTLLVPTLLVLLFPHGVEPSRRWRPVAWMAVALVSGVGHAHAFAPGPLMPDLPLRNPVGIESLPQLSWIAQLLVAACEVVLEPLCLAGLFVRFLHSDKEERSSIRGFLFAATLAVLGLPVALLVNWWSAGSVISDAVYQVIGAVSLLGMPIACMLAVRVHHLYEIDTQESQRLLERSLLYTALVGLVLALFAIAVRLAQHLIPGQSRLGSSLLAIGVIAAVFPRLSGALKRAMDRLFYGRRAHAVLTDLRRSLQSTLAPDSVLPTVAERIGSALGLPYVMVEVWRNGSVLASAAHGHRAGTAIELPLVYQGEGIGRLVACSRKPEHPLDPADLRLLRDIAGEAGVAAHAVNLTADLHRSRERLVGVLEEERSRVRRDLHDGLQPALAGVALGLDAARNFLSADPPAAQGLLTHLQQELLGAIEDLRHVVYDLRPPSLDDLGLVAALRERAAVFAVPPGGPDVVVLAPDDIGPIPPAVEIAAYRIVMEALANIVRHAQAQHCEIVVSRDAAEVVVEVRDDGTGLPPGYRPGVGILAMQERADGLGATLVVESSEGAGTRVLARFPVETP